MDNKHYLSVFEKQLYTLYEGIKTATTTEVSQARIEGYIHAGRVLDLVSIEQVNAIVGAIHMEVFGETANDRKDRNDAMKKLQVEDPEAYLEIPAIERKAWRTKP